MFAYFRKVALIPSLLIIIAALPLLSGCSGGSDSTPAPTTGGLTGYVYIPAAGGAPTIAPTASVPPPPGIIALAGATVAFLGTSPTGSVLRAHLAGGGASTTTDSQGHFTLAGLPPGLGQVSVTPAGGAATDFPVTVFIDTTLPMGQPFIDRSTALTSAEGVVPPGTDTNSLFIMSPQEPLPPGAHVTEMLGNANGDDSSTTDFTPATESWFFYIDPSADLRFQHAVFYVFVDDITGVVTTHAATSYPNINGSNLYHNPTINRNSADLALAPTSPPASRPTPAESFSTPPSLHPFDDNAHTYAILVQGENDDSMQEDIVRVQSMFGKNGLPASISTTIIKPNSQTPRADFQAALKAAIKNAGPKDTIFVYVTSHGNENGSMPLARSNTDGTAADRDDKLFANDFDFAGANVANCTVILDSCYASVTAEAIAKKNAGGGLIIAAATDKTHNAVGVGSWDPRAPTGGVFTTEFVNAFNRLSGYTSYTEAFNVAFNATAITLANYSIILRNVSKMNPQIFFASQYTKVQTGRIDGRLFRRAV